MDGIAEAIADVVLIMVRWHPLLWGKMFMVRPLRIIFLLLLLTVCAVQVMGAACPDDCLRQWSSGPFHAHDQFPGAQDSQTEPDGSEGQSALELALAQGDGLRVIHLTSASCPG